MIGALLAVVLSSSVISVPKGDLYDEDPVVTNVDLSGIGEARSLPKYLHERSFDDSYPDDAEAYYRSRGNGKANGGCSSTCGGGFLSRNFDYPFDDRAEFVVRMSAGAGRFASVGVAQVGTNLTERFVTSGEPSVWYKALPGATVDGINENGVACNINVSDDEPSWGTGPVDDPLHPLAVIRWILDHAVDAQSAAEYVAEHVRFPQGWVQNFHYMVADANGAYIVENGEALPAGEYHEPDEPATMTNFPLNRFPWRGMGTERFGLLLGGANITNAWYTRAYRRETVPQWKSEFSADVLARTNEIFNAWAEHPKEYFRGKTNGGEPWWQTVHTSVYDIQNRVLRLAVQETDDWYVFQVPSVGKVKSVNGMTGDVTLSVPDIPGDIPLARVKNESGNAVGARDVGAFPATLSRFGSNYESTWPIFITPTAKLQGWTIQAGLNLGLNVKKYNEAMTDVFTLNILPDFMQLQRGLPGTPYNVYFPTNAGTLALTSEIESATAGVLRRSDIYDWALQPAKPSYTAREVGSVPAAPYLSTKSFYMSTDSVSSFGLGSPYYSAELNFNTTSSQPYYGARLEVTRQGGMSPDWIGTLFTNAWYMADGIRFRVYNNSVGHGGTFDWFLLFPLDGGGTLATREWVRAEGITETDPTVPDWAKQSSPPSETDPTVPDWAKAPNPPSSGSVYVDPTLGVKWTNEVDNGHVYLTVVTES